MVAARMPAIGGAGLPALPDARCSCQPAQETPFQKDVDGKPCSASDSAYGLGQVTSPHLERER